MRSFWAITVAASVCLLALGGQRACAQFSVPRPGIGQVTQPPLSPYLNLFRSGAPLYQNYYGIVRPEQDWRAAVGSLQQQSANNSQAIGGLETSAALPTTGHAVRFLNTGRYFMSTGGQGGQGGQGGAQRAVNIGQNMGAQAAGPRLPGAGR